MVSIMLGFVGFACVYGWLQTGQKAVGLIGLVGLLLIPAAWGIASRWQTHREQIQSIIQATAKAIEVNDHPRAVSVIGDERTKQMAMSELPKYEFHMAEIHQFRHIEVQENAVPMTALADMTVKVDVSGKRGGFHNLRVLRKLHLEFEKRGEDWVVVHYEHAPVIGNGP